MTNAEKFTTAKERAEAFYKYCETKHHTVSACHAFHWLDLEAKVEDPLPCPFCIKGTLTMHTNVGVYSVWCRTCGYQSQQCRSEEAAVAAHNRVARAAQEKEANK